MDLGDKYKISQITDLAKQQGKNGKDNVTG
jgi:hypothetical protein